MGNQLIKENTFTLAQLPSAKFDELTSESYTVVRTSGEQQTGWRIPSVIHRCHNGSLSKYHAHVMDEITEDRGVKKWRFHMVRDAPDGAHVCGWRHFEPGNRAFWPTRLTTEEEKESWWAMLDILVVTLKRTKEMSDSELMSLHEGQLKREAEASEVSDESVSAEEGPERKAKFLAQRQAAVALDPEMASRHAFWREFDSERDRLMERLKVLRQEAGNNPELEEELEAFLRFYGNEHELADKLQKRMLQQKKDDATRAKMNERSHTLKQLDDKEQAAVARKDYGAAQRAQSQKMTALAHWAEEDANEAK